MHALIRPSPGGTPGHSRSMSLPQAWAITLASWAIAADETSSSAAPSARPIPFIIVASPDFVDSSRPAGGGAHPDELAAAPHSQWPSTQVDPRLWLTQCPGIQTAAT